MWWVNVFLNHMNVMLGIWKVNWLYSNYAIKTELNSSNRGWYMEKKQEKKKDLAGVIAQVDKLYTD